MSKKEDVEGWDTDTGYYSRWRPDGKGKEMATICGKCGKPITGPSVMISPISRIGVQFFHKGCSPKRS